MIQKKVRINDDIMVLKNVGNMENVDTGDATNEEDCI